MRRSGVRLLLPAPENAKRPPLRVAVLFCCKAASARSQTASAAAVSFLCARCPPRVRDAVGAKPNQASRVGNLLPTRRKAVFFTPQPLHHPKHHYKTPSPKIPKYLSHHHCGRAGRRRGCAARILLPKKLSLSTFRRPARTGTDEAPVWGEEPFWGQSLRRYAPLPCPASSDSGKVSLGGLLGEAVRASTL